MAWVIEDRFRIQANATVLAWLDRVSPSAHDEVASALIHSASGLCGVQHYCPNRASYAWLGLHTKGDVLFALATGMKTVGFRLPPALLENALKAGGVLAVDLGPDWIQWQLGWDMDLRPWLKLAFAYGLDVEHGLLQLDRSFRKTS